jgi:hypothetical protein
VSTAATAVSAAAEAATTAVEATASTAANHGVPTAACVTMCPGPASIAGSAASIAVSGACIADSAAVTYSTTVAIAAVAGSTVIAAASPVAATSPISVIPRAGADKDATDEPARAVITVRSACIWSIGIVAPRTYRSSRIPIAIVPVPRANPNTDADLGIGGSSNKKRCGNRYDAEQH